MIIRDVQYNEIPQIKKIIDSTIKVCYPKIYSKEVVEFFIDYHSLSKIKSRAENGVFVAGFLNGKIVASGFLERQELGGVYVLPECQYQGFGTSIVQHLISLAQDKNLKMLWLDSTPIALKLYLNLGFKMIEEKTDYFNGGIPLDYFYMEKKL